MKLLGRSTRPEDLDQCLPLLLDRFLYDDAALQALRDMWRDLIMRDTGRSAVIFESGNPDRVLAFGISAAVSEARYNAILSERAPFIGKALLDEWRSGNDPFLDEASAASASARDGLHVVVMHNGVADSDDPTFFPAALSAMSENFVTQHLGCHMKGYVHEAFGVPREFAEDLGMRAIDYAPEHEARLSQLPRHRMPVIVSMTREDARRHPGNLVMYQIFLNFTPPRCELRADQRRLLRLAREGTPDATIAEVLQIAPRTLKKRWADLYAQMEPVTGMSSALGGGQRGAEIRRHVLRYVREHPEELHAYSA